MDVNQARHDELVTVVNDQVVAIGRRRGGRKNDLRDATVLDDWRLVLLPGCRTP